MFEQPRNAGTLCEQDPSLYSPFCELEADLAQSWAARKSAEPIFEIRMVSGITMIVHWHVADLTTSPGYSSYREHCQKLIRTLWTRQDDG